MDSRCHSGAFLMSSRGSIRAFLPVPYKHVLSTPTGHPPRAHAQNIWMRVLLSWHFPPFLVGRYGPCRSLLKTPSCGNSAVNSKIARETNVRDIGGVHWAACLLCSSVVYLWRLPSYSLPIKTLPTLERFPYDSSSWEPLTKTVAQQLRNVRYLAARQL